MGKAILAMMTDEEIGKLFPAASLATVVPRTLTSVGDLLAEVHRVRRRGYAVNREESEIGVASVGAATALAGAGIRVAMSIATPTMRWSTGLAREHGKLVSDEIAAVADRFAI
jgi:DNA-binding IclR family transcriptional regulator